MTSWNANYIQIFHLNYVTNKYSCFLRCLLWRSSGQCQCRLQGAIIAGCTCTALHMLRFSFMTSQLESTLQFSIKLIESSVKNIQACLHISFRSQAVIMETRGSFCFQGWKRNQQRLFSIYSTMSKMPFNVKLASLAGVWGLQRSDPSFIKNANL